jgi:serine/threonine protein kinase/CHASE2 domain-containing sensor protein
VSGEAVRARSVALAIAATGAIAIAIAAHAFGLLGWLERSSIDARFSLRERHAAPTRVVLVGIDNQSLGSLPRYPFDRRLHAAVIEHLHAAGARLIVYDISFDRPTKPVSDRALLEAAHRSAPVVFATSVISPTGQTEVLGGDASLAAAGDVAAAADLLPDSDGVLRHTLQQVDGLPSIAAEVMTRLDGEATDVARLRDGWIDYPGPPGTVHALSFVNVLRDRFPASAVRGKIVVVGATASTLQDVHNTSVGGPMAGPEVQAAAIETALSGFPLQSAPGWVAIMTIALLALLAPIAGVRLGTAGMCLVGVTGAIVWSIVTQVAFDSGAVLDFSDPLLGLTISTGAAALLGMRADAGERQRLRGLFAAAEQQLVENVLHGTGERRLEATAIIAGYRLEEVIGRGGMGVVYRATQLALDRPVAIKVIAAERAEDPSFRERFEAESRIAASIEHANVIPVYEAGDDDGLLFIAMRLVDGYDLGEMLDRLGALPPPRVAHLVGQLAAALDAAHSRGLVHRDVKPANVLLTADDTQHVYLTDFGLAQQIGAQRRITGTGQWVGTLDYLSPEQIRGESSDARSDVYALAAVLYHCLAGRPPFHGQSQAATLWAHMTSSPPAPSEVEASLDRALDAVVVRGMAKDPSERFESAGALACALSRALGLDDPVPAPPVRRTGQALAPAAGAVTYLSNERRAESEKHDPTTDRQSASNQPLISPE